MALRDELNQALQSDRTDTVELDQAAVGRLSRVDALQQQQMALAEQRRAVLRLDQVQAALEAVRDEEYGYCAKCGEDIGIKRLTARPEVRFCLDCQQGFER